MRAAPATSRGTTTKRAPPAPESNVATPTDGADGALGANAVPKKRKRLRPIGIGLIEKVNPGYVLGLALCMYAFGQFLTHPIDDLRGVELRLDVQRVIDGDTFMATVQPLGYSARFRLKRVDAPELDQPFGVEAKEVLEEILLGQSALSKHRQAAAGARMSSVDLGRLSNAEVVALVDTKDDWGRYVVDVVVRSNVSTFATYVQREMVQRGYAWAFSTFSRQGALKSAMDSAKEAKLGLWAGTQTPTEPWKHRWAQAETKRAGSTGSAADQKTKQRHSHSSATQGGWKGEKKGRSSGAKR
jgi:endonuclease YncB( thermonuclease family)